LRAEPDEAEANPVSTAEKLISCCRAPGADEVAKLSAIKSCQRSVAFIAAAAE
jgi:hypothetical protein